MGERQGWLFETSFNRSVKLRQADDRISDNAGALLLREIDHRLGLTADLAAELTDPRRPDRIRYQQVELLRQHLYALALGHVHQDDHDLLAHDAAVRLAVWDRPGQAALDERLASQPSDWRLLNRLAIGPHRRALREALATSVRRHQQAAGAGRKVVRGTLDVDPFPIEVHGNQPGGAWHGYYRKKIYHPIVASFAAEGTYESSRLGEGFVHAVLRRGNVASGEGAVRFLRETIRKGRELARHLDVRIDAGLVSGKVLDAVDDEGVRFVGRIKNNAVLDRLAEPYLSRPPGRPTTDGDEFAIDLGTYQAGSWSRPYRLVLVIVDLPDPKTGLRKLFPHHFFLITNWPPERRGAWALVEHYRKRGTFEDRLGEFNACVGNGLSAAAFETNEATLLLKLLAFNLAGVIRGELEDASGTGWDLLRVQRTVLKTGARVAKHSRRLLVDISRAAGALWGRVLGRVVRWWRDPSWGHDAATRLTSSKPGRRRGPHRHRWVPPPSHAHLSLVLRE
jgi:hypothetical protein